MMNTMLVGKLCWTCCNLANSFELQFSCFQWLSVFCKLSSNKDKNYFYENKCCLIADAQSRILIHSKYTEMLLKIWSNFSEKCSKLRPTYLKVKLRASVNFSKFIQTPAQETEILNSEKGGKKPGLGGCDGRWVVSGGI